MKPRPGPPCTDDREPCDRQASDLTDLVDRYHAAVYRYAYRLAGRQADADDLTQQTFLLALRRLNQLRSPEGARAWLYAITRNCYLDSIKKRKPRLAQDSGIAMQSIPTTAPPVTDCDEERMHAAVQSLSPEFRVVVLMFYFEQASYQEIATQLNIPAGTVMSRLSRAKSHLRQRLAGSGESIGTAGRLAQP